MGITVVIVSWNTREFLRVCLKSLFLELEGSGFLFKVFVVDNNSADGSAVMVEREFPFVSLFSNTENVGFARANNQVLKTIDSEYVLLLNPDTEIQPGALGVMLQSFSNDSKIGVVAPQLLNSNGTVQKSCRSFPTIGGMFVELIGLSKFSPKQFGKYKMLDFDHKSERFVDQPEGACLLIKKEVLEKVGLFDEQFFMLFEEVDWCKRVCSSGYKIWFTPTAQVVHHYGQSIKQVKAKMIYYSHVGFYHYIKKHTKSTLLRLFGPVLYLGLMFLAGLRIIQYYIKRVHANV